MGVKRGSLFKIFIGVASASLLGLISFFVVGPKHVWTFIAGPLDPQSVVFTSLETSKASNSYLICPKDYCAKADGGFEAPIFEYPATYLASVLSEIVETTERYDEIQSRQFPFQDLSAIDGATEPQISYQPVLRKDGIVYSAMMKYPDLISIEVLQGSDQAQSTVAIYSRSVIGRRDFGVNQQRVLEWMARLEAALSAKPPHNETL